MPLRDDYKKKKFLVPFFIAKKEKVILILSTFIGGTDYCRIVNNLFILFCLTMI